MSRGRYALFLGITLLFPVLLVGAVEGALRLFRPDGGIPLFVEAPFAEGELLVANQELARRYFPSEQFPPRLQPEPFAVAKPEGGLRVFVLGESSTAGFPYPRNGTFSRVLRDAFTDVLPGTAVEVVNLGLSATNSFTLVDMIDEVLDQRPDMVLVYAGHNEYYGALGVGSAQSGGASPALKRLYLRLLRLRTVQLLRDAMVGARSLASGEGAGSDVDAASRMEIIARDQQIELGSDAYHAGLRQFEENLAIVVERCREAGVPLFVASVASNVRDQHPLVSPGNGAADSAYAAAGAALAGGDSARARELFARARDLDVVRFRAPSELNEVVRRVAAAGGAHYVPVAERFDEAGGGMPGSALFVEHVHPVQHGQALIARAFFEAVAAAGFAGRTVEQGRLRPWEEYEQGMWLSPIDHRVAHHNVRTLVTRWPFVSVEDQVDYRGTYRPTGLADSLAFMVSRGGLPWALAKLQLASALEQRGRHDSAAVEYRGLARDTPFAETPFQLLGRALLGAGEPAAAESAFVRAHELAPSAFTSFTLGRLAIERRDHARAIPYLELATRLAPGDPTALYSLSLAYGMAGDLERARAAAERLRRVAPGFPGLEEWRRAIGLPATS
ncbi:MAG TPA: tetratricopeptide repeat protein [Gemmatimonadales bacterium]